VGLHAFPFHDRVSPGPGHFEQGSCVASSPCPEQRGLHQQASVTSSLSHQSPVKPCRQTTSAYERVGGRMAGQHD
jgi:hypothetical protein